MKPLTDLVNFFGAQNNETAPFVIPRLVAMHNKMRNSRVVPVAQVKQWQAAFEVLYNEYLLEFINDQRLQAISILDIRVARLLPASIAGNAEETLRTVAATGLSASRFASPLTLILV
jgi:hypothetical protein